MTKDEALKMAIDLIESDLMDLVYEQHTEFKSKYAGGYKLDRIKYASDLVETTKAIIQQGKKALEQPAQEPVACTNKYGCKCDKHYTHPHQWQGLTDDEILKASSYIDMLGNIDDDDVIKFARAIEQALKEKNT
jgi:hypothetical protein